MSTSHPPARRAHGPHGRGRPRAGHGAPHSQRGAHNSKIAPLHPTETPPDIHSFAEWNLGDDIQSAIAAMQISVPTPIQKLAIGPVLEGRDVIAKAETGTGKTLAFGAPMMAKIDPARASVLGLVLCPTRELAEQVCKVLAVLGAPRGIKTALIVGGEPLEPQVTALKGGAQVVVGTPGRILDLYKQRFLSFPWTEFTILDEADVMLEIGFIDDVKMILSFAPDERQTLLFSATFPPELLKLAREYTKNPVEVATASGVSTVDTIDQVFMKVDDDDRPLALIRMIEQSDKDDVFLVFCDRRTEVDKLMRRLERMPWPVKALHGGYDQEARFRVMTAFRSREVKALIATDVASRGLDVAHVTHVVNYGAPRDVTDYTHRIGRTGRAGRSGRAITLVTPLGMRRWKGVLQDANWKIEEVELPGSTRDQGRRREEPRRGSREPRDDARAPARSEPARSEPAQREPAQREPERSRRDAHREDRPVRRAAPHREERRPRPEDQTARTSSAGPRADAERADRRPPPGDRPSVEPRMPRSEPARAEPPRESREPRRGRGDRRPDSAPPRSAERPSGREGAPRRESGGDSRPRWPVDHSVERAGAVNAREWRPTDERAAEPRPDAPAPHRRSESESRSAGHAPRRAAGAARDRERGPRAPDRRSEEVAPDRRPQPGAPARAPRRPEAERPDRPSSERGRDPDARPNDRARPEQRPHGARGPRAPRPPSDRPDFGTGL